MRVLCVCTGNTCRSPMMAALLRRALDDAGLANVAVASAGVSAFAGDTASEQAQQVMRARGLDISDHRATPVDTLDLRTFDHIYCLSESHAFALHARGVPGAKLRVLNAQRGGISDPFGGPVERYASTADQIEREIEPIIAELKRQQAAKAEKAD